MKISKEKLTQIIKEEFDSLNEKSEPYTTGELAKLLNNIGSDDFVVQIVDQQNQPIGEIWEVWAGEGTLNISVKKH
jgi:hypothetical protein